MSPPPYGPDRPARPLDRHPLPDRRASPGSVVARRPRRLRAEGRARALGRRLGGHRLRVGRGPRAVDREFGGLSSTALMVVVHSRRQDRRRPGVPGRRRRRRSARSQRRRRASTDRRRRRGRARRSRATATPRSPGRRRRATPNDDGARRRRPQGRARRARRPTASQVALTGASGMWSDFNEANKTAMMKSELISWPVTLGILRARVRLARRRRAAADAHDPRPGRLRRLAVPRHAGARHLDLGDELRADVRARARASTTRCSSSMRFRGAFFGSQAAAPRTPSPRRWTPPARPSSSRGADRADLAERGDARPVARRSGRWRSGSCSRSSSSSRRR